MAEITAAAVKALRERTDLPMMKCKQALVEAGGDEEKAVQILRQQVGKLLEKRAENPTSEGIIRILVSDDGSQAAMVELQCESAPVAKSEAFNHLADALARQLLTGPGAASADELLAQPAPGRAGQTLKDLYEEAVNKIGEKIVVARVARVEGPVGGYVHHDGKTGVVFQAAGEKSNAPVLRDVAMHIAAMRPTVTYPQELDAAQVAQERQRLTEEAKATGKPDNVVEKIVDGKLRIFYQEQGVLVEQQFAKEQAKTVSQALAEQGLKAKGFIRWVIGTGG